MKNVKTSFILIFLFTLLMNLVQAELSVKEAVDLYFKVPLYSRLKLAPDGSHLSLILHRDRQDILATYNIAEEKIRSIKGAPGQSIFGYDWIDNDHLVFTVQQWNIYYISMYSVDEGMKSPKAIGEQDTAYDTGNSYSTQILYLQDPLPLLPQVALLKDYTKDDDFPDTIFYKRAGNSLTGRDRNKDNNVDWICDDEGTIRVLERLAGPGETEYLYRKSKDDPWGMVDLDPYSTIQDIDGKRGLAYINYYSDEGNNVFQIFNLNERSEGVV